MIEPGTRLGRFVVVGQIGRGGTGDVFRAHDERLGQDVALKVLRERDDMAPDDRIAAKQRLLREARAAAAFGHPKAAAVYDVGETADGVAYVAMELVDGRSLRSFIGDGTVPLDRRAGWLVDVATVLHAAHDRGLVHRDVKPENVMIRNDGVVKVVDFGLVRRIDTDPTMSTTIRQLLSTLSTQGSAGSGRIEGTPLYMAPEQMRGEPIDRRADQFSWGVMAYELLSGELPWGRGGDTLQLLANLMSNDPRPLAERDAQIPEHVSRAVQRAIAKLPAQRFPTMAAVVAAFEGNDAAADDAMRPAIAPADDASRPAPAGGRSRSRRALLGAAVAVVVAGIAIWRASRNTEPQHSATSPADARTCVSHAACTQSMGKDARCIADVGCVVLAGDGCQVLAEPSDVADDSTVWFGAILPLGKDRWAPSDLHAIDLARRDFATMMRGFGASGAYGRIHPLAVVACDETLGTERAVHHLVDDLRVPAIIGFSNGAELTQLAGSVLGPRGVLVVAPFTTSPLLKTLPRIPGSPRMVFRTTFDSTLSARAMAAVIPAVFEPELRRDPAVIDREHPLRVALVRQSATRLSAFASTFFDAVRFNGKSALDNGANYRELTYDETAPESPTTGYAAARDALVAFAPHVVAYVGGDPMSDQVVVAAEQAWQAANYRPRWLAIDAETPSVLRFVGGDVERRHRFFGVSEVTNTTPNARFVLHYNEVYADKIARTGGPNSSYDAFYVLAYATYALDDAAAVTGPALARAIARLVPPGRPIDVGPAAMFEAFSALRRGETIDLNGATGTLDFDLDTGDAPVDQSLLCIAVDAGGNAAGSVDSGIVYDARTQAARGTMRCP